MDRRIQTKAYSVPCVEFLTDLNPHEGIMGYRIYSLNNTESDKWVARKVVDIDRRCDDSENPREVGLPVICNDAVSSCVQV